MISFQVTYRVPTTDGAWGSEVENQLAAEKNVSKSRGKKSPDATAVSRFTVAKGKERIEFCVVAIGDLREYCTYGEREEAWTPLQNK